METIDKLTKLQNLCKAGIILNINHHRNYYQSVIESMEDEDRADELSAEVLAKMIETDTVIDLQFYPNTPVGFNNVFHYDLDKALDEALAMFEPEEA